MKHKIVISYFQALRSLLVGAKLYVEDNDWDRINWTDDRPQPSKSDVDAEITRLQAEYDSLQYQRDRASEYPTIQDLVVALYDTDDKSDIEAKRAEVKAKYPKPE
jgi:hypothetical protein